MNYMPKTDLETKKVFKKLIEAHRTLANFRHCLLNHPNKDIFLKTFLLQEARESCAIEGILESDIAINNYIDATKAGCAYILFKGLTLGTIVKIQETIMKNNAGFRTIPGTKLVNDKTGETIYTPPDPSEILSLMGDLEKFINDTSLSDLDPLVKMAVIHFKFEKIHPFYDGNGRTGRLINILYLMQEDLLDSPSFNLCTYVNKNKSDYYRFLKSDENTLDWEGWILFLVEGIIQTAENIEAMRHTNRRNRSIFF